MTAYLLFFLMVPHSRAVDLTAELTGGYDSKPALTDPSEGSGFSVYGLGVGQSFGLAENLDLDLLVEGRYQDYWNVEDNYRIQADGAITYALFDGRFLHALIGEGALYRDGLIDADERNEAMVGLRADWILSSRMTLTVEETCRWLDYLNWAMPFSGKGQGRQDVSGGKGGRPSHAGFQDGLRRGPSLSDPDFPAKGKSPLNTLYPPRNNRLLSTGLSLALFIFPSLNGRFYAAYGDLNASLDMESYREIQAGAALSWSPAPEWLADVTRVRETDTIWSVGIQISRFWGDLELFGQAGWKSGDAPLDYESYTQTVYTGT